MGEWVRAKTCSSHTCIEVRAYDRAGPGGETIGFRHVHRDYQGSPMYFTPEEWAAFVQGVKDGDFDDL